MNDVKVALSHLGISVYDIDRMLDFYTRVMGMVVSDTDQLPFAPVRIAFRDLPVEACCRTMKVSRSAFFAWRHHQTNPTARMLADAELAEVRNRSPGRWASWAGRDATARGRA